MIKEIYLNRKILVVILILFFLTVAIGFYYNQKPSDEDARKAYLSSLIGRIDADVKSEFITVNGIRTHYLEAGSGDTLVLVHGAGEGGITWYPIIGKLAKKYRVIAVDVVGYGESDKPDADYDKEYFSNWLKDFFDAKGIRKVDLVGLSQGGAIAFHFTSKNPEYVEKLVLVDSAGFSDVPSEVLLHMFLMNAVPAYKLAKVADPYLVFNKNKINREWTNYGVEVIRMPGGKNVFWQGRGRIVQKIDIESLRGMNKKVLLIHGDKDRLFPVDDAYRLSNQTGVELFVIKNAGHLPFFDEPEIFSEAVIRFLEE